MENDRLAQLERQNALLQIDLDWERERQGFLFRGIEPSPLLFITPVAATSITFLVILALAFQTEMRSVTGAFVVGMLLLFGGAIGTAYHYRRYSAFTKAKDRYSRQRAAIDQAVGEGDPSDDVSGGRTA
jgi:hypothetical protein